MHAISPEVMEGLMEAVDTAESDFEGMVIWSGDAPFSVGADLEATMPAFVIGGADAIESIEQELQNLMLRLRYAQVPVVSAIHGWRWAVAARWRCTRRAAWPIWKAISAWWKWAWAWCPAPAA
jgi:enoyl-CoA hydratase/carnithine racemase